MKTISEIRSYALLSLNTEFFNSIGTFESRVRGLKLTDTVEKLYDKNIIVRRSLSIYFFNAELGDIQKMKVFLAQKTINI